MDHTGGRGYTKPSFIYTTFTFYKYLISGKCSGNEASIKECHEPALWEHYDDCRHSEDVVLSCAVSQKQLQSMDHQKQKIAGQGGV